MERYLIYDADCSVCRQLGEVVQRVAGRKLEAIHIRDSKAVGLLDRARPDGWELAPYLVFAEPGRVRSWTGMAAALRLAALVGPRGAWQIWASARRQGIYLPLGSTTTLGISRRAFVKLTVGVSAALVGLGLLPSTALACHDPCQCTNCRLAHSCSYVGTCADGTPQYCAYYACYDAGSGQFCNGYNSGCACTYFCFCSNPC